MRVRTLVAAMVCSFLAGGAAAQRAVAPAGQQPVDLLPESRPVVPMPGETRLVTFTYDPNDSYTILTMPNAVTDVELRKEERILALALGDGTQWQAQKKDNHLFIRPAREGLFTSATLVTTARTYQLALRSSPHGGKWYQRVSWQYPDVLVMEDNQAALDRAVAATQPSPSVAPARPIAAPATLAVDKLNFVYHIEGEARFRPRQVFDDGTFTYIRFDKRPQELPALFVKHRDGFGLAVYNLEPETPTIKVHRLFDAAVLKLGDEEVTITNRNGAAR